MSYVRDVKCGRCLRREVWEAGGVRRVVHGTRAGGVRRVRYVRLLD